MLCWARLKEKKVVFLWSVWVRPAENSSFNIKGKHRQKRRWRCEEKSRNFIKVSIFLSRPSPENNGVVSRQLTEHTPATNEQGPEEIFRSFCLKYSRAISRSFHFPFSLLHVIRPSVCQTCAANAISVIAEPKEGKVSNTQNDAGAKMLISYWKLIKISITKFPFHHLLLQRSDFVLSISFIYRSSSSQSSRGRRITIDRKFSFLRHHPHHVKFRVYTLVRCRSRDKVRDTFDGDLQTDSTSLMRLPRCCFLLSMRGKRRGKLFSLHYE